MAEPVDFLTVPLKSGGERVRLDRLTDGRIMCQLCFGYFHRDQLNPVDGGVEDVCKPCAVEEREAVLRMTVYATAGGRRFHRYNYCPALHNGRTLWTFNPHELVPDTRETTFIAALGEGKTPCHACMPGSNARLARTSSEDDFGHEPMWADFGQCTVNPGACNCPYHDEQQACARCRHGRQPVLWPCTSAVVLGLVPRAEVTA